MTSCHSDFLIPNDNLRAVSVWAVSVLWQTPNQQYRLHLYLGNSARECVAQESLMIVNAAASVYHLYHRGCLLVAEDRVTADLNLIPTQKQTVRAVLVVLG